MSQHFSVRDVSLHASTKGVRIIVITDIPCHLFCRLSTEEPRIHKIPSYRRGLWLNDDVRFCFTVFEDNEQSEPDDTLIHTFWKTNWDVCVTKWMYFFAGINGDWCVSTSPIFEYHNDGIDPIPPPRVLETYTSIEPQRHFNTGSNIWELQDSTPYVDENATGLVIHMLNRDAGQERRMGVRKTGSAVWNVSDVLRGSQCWACVGLDDDKKWELWGERIGWNDFWVMGYLNENVVFPDDHIDVSPAVLDAWVDVDVGVHFPGAYAAIFDLGPLHTSPPFMGLRMKGSTDNRVQNSYHSWSIIGVNPSGFCECRFDSWPTNLNHLHLIGYFKKAIWTHLNAHVIPDPALGGWALRDVSILQPRPSLVSIEVDSSVVGFNGGARKTGSYRDIRLTPERKCWAFVHPDHNGNCELFRNHANQHFFLCAEVSG